MANGVDPDQKPRSAASDLGLHWLPGLSVRILTEITAVNTSLTLNKPGRFRFERCAGE